MNNEKAWLNEIKIAREINNKINQFGVSDYQRIKLIEFLSLELESRDTMLSILEVIKPYIIYKEELLAPEGEKASGKFNV